MFEFLKIGVDILGALAKALPPVRRVLVRYQMFPLHGQPQPLIRLKDAASRAYDRSPHQGDAWRVVTDDNPLLGYVDRFLEMGAKGAVPIYGTRHPSEVPRQIPRDQLRGRLDTKSLNQIEARDAAWDNVSVRLLDFRRLMADVRTLDFTGL